MQHSAPATARAAARACSDGHDDDERTHGQAQQRSQSDPAGHRAPHLQQCGDRGRSTHVGLLML